MPFYQLYAVTKHYQQYAPIRNLVSSTIVFVKTGGGLVRDIKFWGRKNLAQLTSKRKHGDGDHWTMQFDCNPPTLFALKQRLRRDPRMIRLEIEKIGDSLGSSTRISEYTATWGPQDTIFVPKTKEQAYRAAKLDAVTVPPKAAGALEAADVSSS